MFGSDTGSNKDKELIAFTERISKPPKSSQSSSKNHKEARLLVVGTKKTHESDHMGHTTKKRRTAASTSRKINPYVLRNQELKIEEGKPAKRNIFSWKRRQQQKLEKNTEVLDVNESLRKKVLKELRNKKRQIIT